MENIDLRKALETDLSAAITLLSMIKDDKDLFERVLTMLEEYRTSMIAKQAALDEIE
jgi:hypothetical protein